MCFVLRLCEVLLIPVRPDGCGNECGNGVNAVAPRFRGDLICPSRIDPDISEPLLRKTIIFNRVAFVSNWFWFASRSILASPTPCPSRSCLGRRVIAIRCWYLSITVWARAAIPVVVVSNRLLFFFTVQRAAPFRVCKSAHWVLKSCSFSSRSISSKNE